MNIFAKTPAYEEGCEANGYNPDNDENYNSYSEWKGNQ